MRKLRHTFLCTHGSNEKNEKTQAKLETILNSVIMELRQVNIWEMQLSQCPEKNSYSKGIK